MDTKRDPGTHAPTHHFRAVSWLWKGYWDSILAEGTFRCPDSLHAGKIIICNMYIQSRYSMQMMLGFLCPFQSLIGWRLSLPFGIGGSITTQQGYRMEQIIRREIWLFLVQSAYVGLGGNVVNV